MMAILQVVQWSDLVRESRFILRQKNVLALLLIAFLVSVFAVQTGLAEIHKQQQTIERLKTFDQQDRDDVLHKHHDFGSMAYYSFHLTYLPPSPLAFAAMGQRNVSAWKHRVRMLALEGQIYETDAGNPELSYAGRIDFAFLVSVLAPLFVILLLHDIRAVERAAGRHDLLIMNARHSAGLWLSRGIVVLAALALALLLPFVIGALYSGAAAGATLLVMAVTLLHLLFWGGICLWVNRIHASAPKLAAILLGGWLVTTIMVPVVGETLIEQQVESPIGGDIVLLQREAVNDAWDKPASETFEPFLATHPQWQHDTDMESSFEWKWYYAFQQVGDQTAAELSMAYRHATAQKDQYAGFVAWLSPAMLVQRFMMAQAQTDVAASMAYEQSVRDYHAKLRHFYYPLLFKDVEFDVAKMAERPEFQP